MWNSTSSTYGNRFVYVARCNSTSTRDSTVVDWTSYVYFPWRISFEKSLTFFPSMWRHIPEALNLLLVGIKNGRPSSKILKSVSVALNSYSPSQLITDLYTCATLYMLWLCGPPPAVSCFRLRFCIKECRQAHKFGLKSNSRECSLQSVHVDALFWFINL
jgi:hypothetical protein